MPKESLVIILVRYLGLVLLTIVLSLLIMIYVLLEYVKMFEDQTIELNDFSIWFEFDLKDSKFQGDENLLKASIILYFKRII
jgi:hypothetical protein